MIRLASLSHGLVAESLRAVGCVAAVAVALATVCGEGQQAEGCDAADHGRNIAKRRESGAAVGVQAAGGSSDGLSRTATRSP